MESFVSIVLESNYKEFFSQDIDHYKLLLFTDKKGTSPLYMALSKEYKGKIIFGQVRQSELSLCKKFNIEKFPTLMIVTDYENYKGEVHQGEMKKEQIMNFLRPFAYDDKK